MRKAIAAGVEVLAYKATLDASEIVLIEKIVFDCDRHSQLPV